MILRRVESIPGECRVPELLAGIIIPQILALFFIAGRIHTRVRILKLWSLDDSLIVIAWINAVPITILYGVATKYGHGYHMNNVPFELLKVSFTIVYVTLIFYQLALAFTKLSILVFYLRVFPGKRERIMCWTTIAIVIAYSTALLIADILSCQSVGGRSYFGPNVKCTNLRTILVTSTICHTITDVWIIVMVLPVIWKLQLPRGQRYSLMAVLSLGILVTVASIARASAIGRVSNTNHDLTWFVAEFDIWTIVEVCVGLICACAPTLRPLLLKIFPVFMASHSGQSKARFSKHSARVLSGRVIELSEQEPASDGRILQGREGSWRESRGVDKWDTGITADPQLPYSSLR
ncbi:uncharacterized protein L3040_004669 [Drepanopeziza brunnea f. sp. 'multigermtubi']|uniref:uncharacterized protein n=1 Tax=Drepanopeziza brunnea f. sp. 'multigermtubi' TaxID=698441 RepID=UPI0023915373|nr:hypothetical protein L3040_004669 [Drepanopeziza brunnea f. sp. 'multigermtubi']